MNGTTGVWLLSAARAHIAAHYKLSDSQVANYRPRANNDEHERAMPTPLRERTAANAFEPPAEALASDITGKSKETARLVCARFVAYRELLHNALDLADDDYDD